MRILILLVCSLLCCVSFADPIVIVSKVTAVSELADNPKAVKKLEDRAVAVMAKASQITPADARAFLRRDTGDQVDIHQCMEYLIMYQIKLITQATVTETTVENIKVIRPPE